MREALRRRPRLNPHETFVLVLLVIVVVVNTRLSSVFLTEESLSTQASQSLEIGFMALAATLVIIVREIDLSIASMLGLIAVVFAELMGAGVPLSVAIVAALVLGALLGCVNGMIVTRFGLSSLVVTLATLVLYRGIAEVLVTDRTLVELPSGFVGADVRYIGDSWVTWPQVLFVALAVAFALVLARSRLGRVIQFTGSNPVAAEFSGVRVNRLKVGLFAMSGVMSAVAALALTSRLASARGDIGVGLELPVITAVLLGGTALEGGRGTILGTVLAVVLIACIRTGLLLGDVSDQVASTVIGGLLVLSLLLAVHGKSLRKLSAKSRGGGRFVGQHQRAR
jgi:rhamnose transport system permease protein